MHYKLCDVRPKNLKCSEFCGVVIRMPGLLLLVVHTTEIFKLMKYKVMGLNPTWENHEVLNPIWENHEVLGSNLKLDKYDVLGSNPRWDNNLVMGSNPGWNKI